MNRVASLHYAEARYQLRKARETRHNTERVRLARMFHGLARAALKTDYRLLTTVI